VSAVSEWYSWTNDLRQNPNIQVLASVDPSSFPLGTDPNQSWTGGYRPILWTNKNFKMLYANFGHNWMNYSTNTPLSTTFGSPAEDAFVIDGLLWLGGGAPSNAPTNPIRPPTGTPWSTRPTASALTRGASARRTAPRSSSSPATARPHRASSSSRPRPLPADRQPEQPGPRLRRNERVHGRQRADPVVDLQRRPEPAVAGRAGGQRRYHIVNRNGGTAGTGTKCLTVPNSSTADSTQLVQLSCTGASSQSFRLVAQP